MMSKPAQYRRQAADTLAARLAAHAAKMQTVFAKLTAFFERFLGLS